MVIGCIHRDISALKFPKLTDINISPIILLCSGTGIAPMRSFLQQCYFRLRKTASSSNLRIYLAYGCRYLNKDSLYIFSEEFSCLEKEKILSIFCKGSRDGTSPKIYLQHILKDNMALFKDLIINNNAYIFLCGNSKLPKAIRETLVEFVGEEQMTILEQKNRFQYESW